MRKHYMYQLQCIRDSIDWPKGTIIWADQRCIGWRVVGKMEIK